MYLYFQAFLIHFFALYIKQQQKLKKKKKDW